MQNPVTAPAIAIRDAYLAHNNVVLFDNLNLSFASGKVTCLLGPSGVGKTTLLRIVAGLISADNQQEMFRGDISCSNNVSLSEQISYMAQTDLLLPWLSALDNALLGAKLRGSVSDAIITQAKNLFSQMGLTAAEKKLPHQLSGGMRQRVALIRTLLENKPIILMDEPFSALDAITRFQLQTLTAELLKNRTVVLVTHDPLEALRLGHDIYILSGQPAKIELAANLTSATPRNLNDPEITDYQATLFHLLTTAKELSQ